MFSLYKKAQGFTLIELLVVIAIIGILAAIIIASLTTATDRAQLAAAQSTAAGMVPGLLICSADGDAITTPTVDADACSPANGTEWSALPDGWSYGTLTHTPPSLAFTFTVSDGTTTISCDETGCTTTP